MNANIVLKGGLVAVAAIAAIASAGESPRVPQEKMRAIYEEVKTPHKVGMVLLPEKGEKIDGPSVFRYGDAWYMIFITFDGKGYETHLAKSDDLVKWERLGKVFDRAPGGCWDSAQADGWPLLLDPRWEGPNTLNTFDGRYWMMYIGGAMKGYETDPLSTGVAWTDDPSAVKQWTRYPKNPVLAPSDADARAFERKTIFKHYVVEDPSRSCGGRFVDFYNAKQKGVWRETIGMAVSDDMLKWRRVGDDPVISDGNPAKFAISGDPMIRRIGDTWVMFYFGCGWKRSGAFDTFACSYDLKNWTKWDGEPLVQPSEPYDKTYAHKPWVIKHNGVVYHFYCAVGNQGRGIALATSKPLAPGTSAAEYKPEKWNLEAREKFAEHRYGVFIVWGLYANYAQGEWYLHSGRLDRDAYERMVHGFYPSKYNAREWARIVRKSGAKYITITARHHDGFALWPSKVDDYNISATPFKRDIIGELAEACKEEGIELSLYYSLLDWHRSDYTPGRAYLKQPVSGMRPNYDSYKRYMMGQITELLDNYHPINIWFDGEWDHLDKDRGGTFDWGFDDIFDLIHSRKALVANNNHRAPRPKEDIQLFERDLPGEGTMFSKNQPLLDDRPVEQCDVIQAGVWGYKIGEKRFLTAEESVALIVRAAAKGSNLLLNIGPDGSGQIPAKAVEVFEGIGKWFEKNGDSIYGTKAGGVSMGKQVVSTRKGDTLYIHFLDPTVKEFTFLLGGKKTTVTCERAEGDVSDIVVRFPLGGKEPAQYVVPGSRQTWKIIGETCKNPGNASAALDGNVNSLWHSHPEPMKDHNPLPPPQSFTVDCGAVREMRGFKYTPRPASCSVGVVDKCEFWVSLDGKEWTKAGDGSFPDVMESRKTREVKFAKSVTARYFRFVATHALPVNDRLAVAEVDVM